MTKFIQLRNRFSNNILTDSQQKNTKGRGREMSKDMMYDFEPATSITPTTSFPTNNPNQGNPKNTPKGPQQFGPEGSMVGPMI